eukprot:NODE_71_length_2276_cov_94.649304_g50_i0.p1 GENE.NODE_71_length_2276_cov_94.649304_g50_i0~~NODE_71_length_2276_cov_94.649304_g50_i0.p1  ORF type:complete len:714 (-),score=191.95 NODE_71_length_2276_cov_94.649304_g50_i0:105-2246(-)
MGAKGTDASQTIWQIELWNRSSRVAVVTRKHTGVYGESLLSQSFGGFAWHPLENRIVYVAEADKPDPEDSWNPSNLRDEESTPAAGSSAAEPPPKDVGGSYIMRESWGEGMPTVQQPALFQVDFSRGVVEPVSTPKGTTCGHPQFCPDGLGVIYVGWKFDRKLGVHAYTTRPSALYYTPLPLRGSSDPKANPDPKPEGSVDPPSGQASAPATAADSWRPALLPEGSLWNVVRPRFDPTGRQVVFMASPRILLHSCCLQLYVARWSPEQRAVVEPRLVVDVVDRPTEGDRHDQDAPAPAGGPPRPPGFAGLYDFYAAARFLSDGIHVVNCSIQRSFKTVYLINTETGAISDIGAHLESASEGKDIPTALGTPARSNLNLLCVDGNTLVVSKSTVNSPPSLHVCPDALAEPNHWMRLADHCVAVTLPPDGAPPPGRDVQRLIAANSQVFTVRLPGTIGEAIVALPARPHRGADGKSPPPLVLMPHGGPHGSSTNAYSALASALLAFGIAVAYPNYPGSLGFGQDYVKAIVGKAGRIDVDFVLATLELLVSEGLVDAQRVAVWGASHGGFLGAHLSAIKSLSAAVLFNPVVHLPSMVAVSDIPDWCFAECGRCPLDEFSRFAVHTEEDLVAMMRASPYAHIARAAESRTPTLILLGADDLRVPPSQGKLWYHSLGQLGIPVRLRHYPGQGHPIASANCSMDVQFESLLFLTSRLCV